MECMSYLAQKRFFWPSLQADIGHSILNACSRVKQRHPVFQARAPLESNIMTSHFKLISVNSLHLKRSIKEVMNNFSSLSISSRDLFRRTQLIISLLKLLLQNYTMILLCISDFLRRSITIRVQNLRATFLIIFKNFVIISIQEQPISPAG